MICPKCREETPDESVFCCRCGHRLSAQKKCRSKSRGNGSGTAFKRGSTWTAQVVIGWRDPPPLDLNKPDKKKLIPIKLTKGGFKTKSDALAYCPTLKARGVLKPDIAPTLQFYWDNYEKNEFLALSSSKQTAYKIAWNKMTRIHQATVDQLTVADLRETVGSVAKTYYTAKDCRTVLTNLFRLAAADGYVNKDLPSFVQLPKQTETEREAFNDMEQASLWRLYESGDIRAAVPLLMIYTGMMPGEVMDLTVDMIHLDERQIVGAGKKTNVRKNTPVVIAANIIPVLEDLIANAKPSGRLFGSSEDIWRANYYAALEAAGCRRLSPYSCRHTTATALAITEGIAPQTIRKVMRWSTSRMLDRYAHPDRSDVIAAVDQIGKKQASAE